MRKNPYAFNIKTLWRFLVNQFFGVLCVLLPDPELHAAQKVGPKPVHPNQILVTQNAVNAFGIENAFDNRSLRQISVTPEHDEVRVFR